MNIDKVKCFIKKCQFYCKYFPFNRQSLYSNCLKLSKHMTKYIKTIAKEFKTYTLKIQRNVDIL